MCVRVLRLVALFFVARFVCCVCSRSQQYAWDFRCFLRGVQQFELASWFHIAREASALARSAAAAAALFTDACTLPWTCHDLLRLCQDLRKHARAAQWRAVDLEEAIRSMEKQKGACAKWGE